MRLKKIRNQPKYERFDFIVGRFLAIFYHKPGGIIAYHSYGVTYDIQGGLHVIGLHLPPHFARSAKRRTSSVTPPLGQSVLWQFFSTICSIQEKAARTSIITMAIYRTISSVLLVGKLLARAHCWAPPAWFRPLGTTLASQLGGGVAPLPPAYSQSTCPATLLRSSLSIDTSEVTNKEKSTSTTLIIDDPAFLKPDRDPRQYRMIRLANNLQVLLVSDQLAVGGVGVEAAAVHVQAGHFDDTVPGLAHFHEHLLFLGESIDC